MKFILKSNYKYEIEAKNKEDAIEKWMMTIDEELGRQNQTLANELCESIYAEEVK